MDDGKKIALLQRKTVPGPKTLSEFATTQDAKNKPTNVVAPQKDKKFGVVQTYVRPKGETITSDQSTFEQLKLEGFIAIHSMV